MRILANDGIAEDGRQRLTDAGHEVITEKVAQEELAGKIKDYDVLIVRSATKVNRQILEGAQHLKLVVRAGVGVDNIDIAAAKEYSIDVANTPQSSSLSVAELVFAHLFALARFIHTSNRDMNASDAGQFNDLKKKYSNGIELRGKTLGLIGFGRIGQETAKIAVSLGMKVLYHDHFLGTSKLRFDHLPFEPVPVLEMTSISMDEVLGQSDFISLHVPFGEGMKPLIDAAAIAKMKKGAGIINCARGGVIDESALLDALASGQLSCAGLDVFANEPVVKAELLSHPKISLTPHIGASTREGQDRIGLEVAQVVLNKLSKN